MYTKDTIDVAKKLAAKLEEAVRLVHKETDDVIAQQQTLHYELDATFERIIATARARHGLLAAEIDTLCAIKHKQLVAQSDSLVTTHKSLQNSVAQIDYLRTKNDHVHALQNIMQLRTLLANERELELEPVELADVRFTNDAECLAAFGHVTQSGTVAGMSIVNKIADTAFVGVTISFDITAVNRSGARRTTGGDPFVVVVQSDDDTMDVAVTDHDDGTYAVMYTPTSARPHTISITYRDQHVKNSPFSVSVFATLPFECGPTTSKILSLYMHATLLGMFTRPPRRLRLVHNNTNDQQPSSFWKAVRGIGPILILRIHPAMCLALSSTTRSEILETGFRATPATFCLLWAISAARPSS